MKRLVIAGLFFTITIQAFAQKNIDGLIQAEQHFAAYSVAHSTKESFLENMDSTAIMFDKGKPVNGFQLWSARKQNTAVLNWWPTVASISASGDFGFTTGPWTFQRSSADTIIAHGQYSTVWRIDENGKWKFLVDLGVSGTPADNNTIVKKIKASEPGSKGTVENLEAAEKDFISIPDIKTKYKKYISHEFCTLNRDEAAPATSGEKYAAVLIATPENIQYTMNGSGIASSGDLGYTYGTTTIKGTDDNYLRIWRNEKDGWKIVLEVLHY